MKNALISKILIVAVCIAAVAIGFILNQKGPSDYKQPEISGFAFPDPIALSDINLIDENEDALTAQFRLTYLVRCTLALANTMHTTA